MFAVIAALLLVALSAVKSAVFSPVLSSVLLAEIHCIQHMHSIFLMSLVEDHMADLFVSLLSGLSVSWAIFFVIEEANMFAVIGDRAGSLDDCFQWFPM